jgi:hypothetical protein
MSQSDSVISEKPQADRLKESIAVLKKLTVDLGIPYVSPEVQELKAHFDRYIKDGICWNGTVSFTAYGRVAMVNLPRAAKKPIEVTLKQLRLPK